MLQLLTALGYYHLVCKFILRVSIPSNEIRLLVGLGIIGVISQIICLMTAASWPIQVSIYTIGLFPWTLHSVREPFIQNIKAFGYQPKLTVIAFILLTVLSIILMAGPIIRDDSESYHLQSIKWMQEYGTVPGLANLHARLGFNSSWLSIISVLTPQTGSNYYSISNSLLSLTICSALLNNFEIKGIRNDPIPKKITGAVFMALLLSIWYYWRGNIQSTNYDYYFFACCLVIAINYQNKLIKNNDVIILGLIVPPMLFCTRPLYAPTLLLTAYSSWVLIQQKNYATLIRLGSLGAIGICSYLIRNYMLSGYILFPNTWIDIADSKWKIPKAYAQIQWEYINNFSWNRNLEFVDGLKAWLQGLYYYDLLLVLAGTCSLILIIPANKTALLNKLIFGTALLMILCWLYISPEPRFIAGLLFTMIYLALNKISSLKHLSSKYIAASKVVLFYIIFISAALTFKKLTDERELYANYFTPSKIPNPRLQVVNANGFTAVIPERIATNWNCRCYLSPLPCVYDSLPGVKLIGKTINEGFYIEHAAKRKISEN